MKNALKNLFALTKKHDGINNKARLTRIVSDAFHLTKDRSIYYCLDFAIRFSSSAGPNFGNTVLSLSNLRKFDDRPFIVCLVTPKSNYCLIAGEDETLRQQLVSATSYCTLGTLRWSTNSMA